MIGMNWTKSVGKIGGIIWVDWAIRSQIAATWKKIDFHCISSLWIIRSFISNQLKLIQSWFNRNPLKNPPDIDLKMTPNWHETDMKLTWNWLTWTWKNWFQINSNWFNQSWTPSIQQFQTPSRGVGGGVGGGATWSPFQRTPRSALSNLLSSSQTPRTAGNSRLHRNDNVIVGKFVDSTIQSNNYKFNHF